MSNPQDHYGTPPPPSPSNSSSSTPPSESPKPRFRRQKILSRKTVASGALRKVLNERLKASQVKENPAQNSDSNSKTKYFRSATEGDGHGSSDSDKTQEFPTKGGSGSGEAAEGLVHLSKRREEPVSSAEDTLANLLKRIGACYDPKKRKTTTPKAPNVPKPSQKRKASSQTRTASSVPRGRATRSRVKQSEADLQKALEESKKK
uniref:Protein ENL-like n=1 Tax=Nicotiana tabacum TaxID=4097 RepID=A0A1S3Z3W9_TOBAC|nr:PREDICTED: uncharacterized protein LOC107782714 [Nicotiana tabacum]